MTCTKEERLKRMMTRLKLGVYASSKSAQDRLNILNAAFEDETEWSFEREREGQTQVLWCYYPLDMSNFEEISSYVRAKSIQYKKALQEVQEAQEAESE